MASEKNKKDLHFKGKTFNRYDKLPLIRSQLKIPFHVRVAILLHGHLVLRSE
jgi:hypothetical protein